MTVATTPATKPASEQSLRVSKYLVVSERSYAKGRGPAGRLAYNTAEPRLSVISEAVGRDLAAGHVPDGLPSEVLAHLVKLGLLVRSDQDQLDDMIRHQRSASQDRGNRAWVLVPTAYCNMGCDYCGQTHRRGGISAEVQDSIVQRVVRGIEDPATQSAMIKWFGAEPMMAYATMLHWSSHFVAAARERGIPLISAMTSNGVLLTPKKLLRLYDECNLRSLIVTVDGKGAVHDVHRPLKSGSSSYQKIVAALAFAAQDPRLDGLQIKVRTNVDIRNADQIEELLEDLAAQGLVSSRLSLDLHPVYNWGNDLSAVRLDTRTYGELEIGLLRKAIGLGFEVPLVPRVRRDVVCVAVTDSSEVISATGQVFSCTEHPLVDTYEATESIGHVTRLSLLPTRPAGRYDGWHDTVASGGVGCTTCQLLPVCGGGCPKHWAEGQPPCPSMKFNLQGRLDLAAEQAGYSVVDVLPVGKD